MTLKQLEYVIKVAKIGTISEAAKALFISQPSLTNAIKELESEMKIQIFNRSNKGIVTTRQGDEFLGYARQVVEQADLLEQQYLHTKPTDQHFSVSAHHYSFAVNAFVDLINKYGSDEYEFTLRETRTHEIIEDVKHFKSEIGILYLNEFNEKVIDKLLKESKLVFNELFTATPHIFISKNNPLAQKKSISLEDLEDYPYLSFEQGEYNSFYFSEEILSALVRKKNIKVRDRASLFNLLIGLNGYTISTGIISKELNGEDVISLPLEVDESMRVGTIAHKDRIPSYLGEKYLEALKLHTRSLPSQD